MRLFRKPSAWEVVDHTGVSPVMAMAYSDFNDDDHDIVDVSETDVRGTYFFDLRPKDGAQYLQRALMFARQQLMKETSLKGYNTLIREGWDVTTLRKGSKRRVEVQYRARPALVSGKMSTQLPPFLDMLTYVVYHGHLHISLTRTLQHFILIIMAPHTILTHQP
ncbi:hypothetical protein BU17DRAFT_44045 [Hysterangium stoloniferum]|nr:hypothetical protein BU17DRAFT_44045 [Hysterangium stoloniferum]